MTEALFSVTEPLVKVDGNEVAAIPRDLMRLEVDETTVGLKTLELRLLAHGPREGETDEGLLYLDGDPFDFGKEVEVLLGAPDERHTVFKGVVSAVEGDFAEAREPEVVVFAEDRLMDLRMTRRSRTYEDVSDADIAEEIATEHGLSADTAADGPTYDFVRQLNMSDLAFLRERAAYVRAEVWVEGDTLFFHSRADRPAPAITLVQGNQLISVQIRADLAHQRTAVKLSGYDAANREMIDEEAGPEVLQEEISGGVTGPDLVQEAYGERVCTRVLEAPLNDGEAADWARAEMLRRGRRFVCAGGLTNGTPDMVVGAELTLQRVGPAFDGPGYRVTRVCHTYDRDCGFRTRFEAERPAIRVGA